MSKVYFEHMTSLSDVLVTLETLLDEYYRSTTSNERKFQIQTILETFVTLPNSWSLSLTLMTDDLKSDFVRVFALNTLQTVIEKRWLGLMPADRSEIRKTMFGFLIKQNHSLPLFIRNKVVKLMVDIARTDWPHFYPDFFDSIANLMSNNETLLLGLSILLTASQELTSNQKRRNLSSDRKQELKNMFRDKAPQFLELISVILEDCLQKSSGEGVQPLFHEFQAISLESMECVSHLFSWIPLNPADISQKLLSILLQFANIGLETSDNCISIKLGCAAMDALNEIVCRKCIPMDFGQRFLYLVIGAFQILQKIVHQISDQQVNILYLNKFSDFLYSFISDHLFRYESTDEFPILEFLHFLFKYTFLQPSSETFLFCIKIWNIFIDQFSSVNSVSGFRLCDYTDVLVFLSGELLRKIQFRLNSSQIDENFFEDSEDNYDVELNTEDDEDCGDGGTRRCFLRICIEFMMKMADHLPDHIIQIVDCEWKQLLGAHLQLDSHIQDGRIVLSSQLQCDQLHVFLLDFSSFIQLIGRIASLFVGDSFMSRLTQGSSYVKELIELASFNSRLKLYRLQVQDTRLTSDFITVHSQTLAALQAWSHWLAQLHRIALKTPSPSASQCYETLCREITSNIVLAVTPIFQCSNPPQDILHSAVHFLNTLTGTVRPPSIWKLKEFTELYGSVVGNIKLVPQDHRIMVKALSNVLLLPWPGMGGVQRWDERQKYMAKFLRDLTVHFWKIRHAGHEFVGNKQLQIQAKNVICHTLKILSDLIDIVSNEVTNTKKLCHDVLRDYIDATLWLFPIYAGDSQVCSQLLAFFLVLFSALRAQMGFVFVENALSSFFAHFKQNNLVRILILDQNDGHIMENLLKILQYVAMEQAAAFRKFIPTILAFCLDHIYPLVADIPSADIKISLYSLLYHVLLHNWRLFFKRSSSSLKQPGSRHLLSEHNSHNDSDGVKSNVETDDSKLLQNRFLFAIRAFGESFLLPDVTVIKHNIMALEHLHFKWKLYEKSVFTESGLIVQFLNVFLRLLSDDCATILKEDICMAIYNMASVDMSSFFNNFLPQFLENSDGLDDNQRQHLRIAFKHETDLPTFTLNVDRFTNDLAFYRLCNQSLTTVNI